MCLYNFVIQHVHMLVYYSVWTCIEEQRGKGRKGEREGCMGEGERARVSVCE